MKKKVRPLGEGEYWLEIMRCESHGFWSIMVNKDTGGTRITPSKCCGCWETVAKWRMTGEEIRSEVEEATK